MLRVSIKSIILTAFAAAVLVIGFFVWATFRNMQEVLVESKKINSCSQVQQMIDKIHADLEAAETASGNFIYAPDDSSYLSFKLAESRLLADTLLLNRIIEYDRSEKPGMLQLKQIVLSKTSLLKNADSIYNSNIGSMAAAVKEKASHKQELQTARKLLDVIETKNRDIIIQSGFYQEKIAQNTSYQFLMLAGIFLILAAFLFFIITRGLNQQQKNEQQLKYQASLINSVPDAIITTDSSIKITAWNKYAEEIYGYAEAEVLGKNIGELIRLELSKDEHESSLNELNNTGSYRDEYAAVKKDGTPVYILASVTIIKNDDDEITGYVAVHRDISARKNAEKKLQAFTSELAQQVQEKTAEISSIMQRITDGFLALDNNFTFTFVNKQAGETLGHLPGQMVGKNIFTDFPETASKNFNDACVDAYQSQQRRFLENHYDPLNIWIENDIYPSPDGLTVFFKDITFKKQAELALKESEAHYRRLIENMHAGVVVHHPDTRIVLSNPEAARLLGLPAEKLAGKKSDDSEWHFFTADGKKMELQDYPVIQVINTKKPVYNLIAGIDTVKNKGRVWVLVNAFPEFDTNNELKQVVVIFVDITDRKKAEEELKHREDVLNKAQSIAKIGSWELDIETNKLIWSKEQYRIFELEDYAGEDLNAAYRCKFQPEDYERINWLMKKSVETGSGFSINHHIICKNGDIKNILCIGETIKDPDGRVITLKGTVQDITEMKKTEERLQKSYEQIRQLAAHLQNIREDERTNMAREIHDELGQQLTGLNMYISWLYKKIQPQDAEIKEKFSSAVELIDDTVKVVRKISTKLRPSMLDDLGLIAAIEWQSNEFEKRSGIKTEFVNLSGNITIPGTLTTGLFRIYQESLTNVARHAEASKIISSLEQKGSNLQLKISDNGKGFVLNEIGTKKTLGLFGMKERTMVMGGQYEIKTSPGEGTTVCITVPLNGNV